MMYKIVNLAQKIIGVVGTKLYYIIGKDSIIREYTAKVYCYSEENE
jgi:hypothetical protein